MFDDDKDRIEAAIDKLLCEVVEALVSTIRDLIEEGYFR